MKIVYCIAATSNSGGMERVLTNKANYFAKLGFDVHIVTTDQRGMASFFDLDPRVQQHDLGINYVLNNGRGLLEKLFSYRVKQRQHHQRLDQLLHQLQPDITVSMFDHEVSFLYKIGDGSRKIVEIHFSRFKRLQYGRRGIWGFIDQWRSKQDVSFAKRYERFVVLTQEDKGYWGALPNIRVIPNANSFVPTSVSDLTSQQVIAVGRYDYQKRFEDLVYAWKEVKATCPGWSLNIFGHGPLRDSLQRQIQSSGLQDVVKLREPVKNIEGQYVQHALLAMTSRYEGLPMALLEAQACGLPLVAYACKCGPRDIISDGENGFLINEGDTSGLAKHIIQLIEDDTLRKKMGQEAKRLSLQYAEEVVMKYWLDLFDELHVKA
ncbi:glycosyltransferase family 4 protein [Sphingobacterium deserti]|uniref:Putative glycosyltransferase n=1 Tax=Sphingobacterium deserti TaxID=1229276 RepID=A0A0B8T752_9SPHI|nr:glycosyltransferase family 4 protein [Sphingobacterium deserti]KGE14159.1 putative glycosyltransferase [Sphingobacterium deserti]